MSFIALALLSLTLPPVTPNADSVRRPTRARQAIVITAIESARRKPPVARHGAVRAVDDTGAAPNAKPAPPAASFSWPGTYDIVGSGFPEGERKAVMEIGQTGTSYTLQKLIGPPGNATLFEVIGDRARIVWNLGTELMYVDLRGRRDSLAGEWFIGDEGGQIRGARRR